MFKPYKRTANYYETDQMGIIHHSNYIRWFEEARIDMLEQLGIGYAQMEKEGILIPVLSVECEYRRVVHFYDQVEIRVKLLSFTGVKMEIGYEIFDEKTGELCTTGKTSHCFLDRDLKLVMIKRQKPHIYEVLKSAVQ